MNIKGLYKTSLIDFPGRISAVIFTGGCNLRCNFCHNPDLARDSTALAVISEDEIFAFLEKRKGILDGITITGGEPTLQKDIIEFMKNVKDLGYEIKLDTNGLLPKKVKNIVDAGVVDYFAIDLKTSPIKFKELTQSNMDFSLIAESLNILNENNVDYETRTTCVPKFVTTDDIDAIGAVIPRVKAWHLQQFISSVELMDNSMENSKPYSVEELKIIQKSVLKYSDICDIRGI